MEKNQLAGIINQQTEKKNSDNLTNKKLEKTGKLKCKQTAGTKDRQTDRQNNRHDRYIDKQT